MIKPNHICGLQINFADMSSKEGPDFRPVSATVSYREANKTISYELNEQDDDLYEFITGLVNRINYEQ